MNQSGPGINSNERVLYNSPALKNRNLTTKQLGRLLLPLVSG